MTHHRDIALLLAAGEARRMGSPKQTLEWAGSPLLLHALRTAQLAELWPVVVLGAHRERVEPLLPPEVERVVHPGWAAGMGSSLVTGLRAVLERHAPERVTVMVCDQPLIAADGLKRLVASCHGVDAAAAAYEGTLGTPACFARSSFPALLTLGPAQGARRLLRGGALNVVSVPMERAALDLDTPEDVARARAALGAFNNTRSDNPNGSSPGSHPTRKGPCT